MAATEEKTGFALVLQNIMTYRTVKARAEGVPAVGG
jgi:hypothetical protein